MLIELLESFSLDEQHLQPFILQLNKTYARMNELAFLVAGVVLPVLGRASAILGMLY